MNNVFRLMRCHWRGREYGGDFMLQMRGVGKGSLSRLQWNRPSKGLFGRGNSSAGPHALGVMERRTYLLDLRRERYEA